MRDKPRWEIIHGDSLTVMESFPPSTFDAVITEIVMQTMIQGVGKIKKYAFAV